MEQAFPEAEIEQANEALGSGQDDVRDEMADFIDDPNQEAEAVSYDAGPDADADADDDLEVTPPVPDADAEADDDDGVEYPEFLLEAAGLTAEEAHEQFGSPDVLAKHVRALDMRTVSTAAQQPPPPQPLQAAATPAAPPPVAAQPPASEFKLPKPSAAEDWDEDTKALVAALRAQQDAELAKRDTEMSKSRAMLETLLQSQRQATERQYVAQFDGFIEQLGDDWKTVFGAGSGYELPRNSIGMQNRAQLDIVAQQLADGHAARGLPPLSTEHLLARALQASFPQQHEREIEREVTAKVTKRQQMHTSRPTQRRGKPLTGLEKAAQNAENWYAKHANDLADIQGGDAEI